VKNKKQREENEWMKVEMRNAMRLTIWCVKIWISNSNNEKEWVLFCKVVAIKSHQSVKEKRKYG
jgi:hypothetical protein